MTCRWFALCGRPSTGVMPHPVLGDVPICDRCRAKIEDLATVGRDRGEGLPVLLFAVAVAILAVLAFMSFAQGIAREAEQRICVTAPTVECPDGPRP